jgi:hypothetical protein
VTSNTAYTNGLTVAGQSNLAGGAYISNIINADLTVGNGGAGIVRMNGSAVYNVGDYLHLGSPYIKLDGGLVFTDGSVQWTAAQRGNGPVRNAGGNNFYCDGGYVLVGLHYECGCTNNATWFECQPA